MHPVDKATEGLLGCGEMSLHTVSLGHRSTDEAYSLIFDICEEEFCLTLLLKVSF